MQNEKLDKIEQRIKDIVVQLTYILKECQESEERCKRLQSELNAQKELSELFRKERDEFLKGLDKMEAEQKERGL